VTFLLFLFHVAAGAVGVSALIMASAEAFALLKWVGALYLVGLGLKTMRDARLDRLPAAATVGIRRAFRDGIVVEAVMLNTAVDIAVVVLASRARDLAFGRPTLLARARTGAGPLIAGLGVGLLLSRRPA
jgi:threonine/homoserine/homoserine lactone efflux protein